MRSDWVPLSASALVVGVMSLVFGSLLNPADAGSGAREMVHVVNADGSRYLAMAVMFGFASVTLTFGMPSVLTLFERRGRRLGLGAVVVFTVGAVGTCGYAVLLVFFRALVAAHAVDMTALRQVSADGGLAVFLRGWIGCFYGGVLLLAVALLVARSTPRWVPVALIVFVAALPFASELGRVAQAVQVLLLAAAFTGVAMASVTALQTPRGRAAL